jgi:hypothetical protein
MIQNNHILMKIISWNKIIKNNILIKYKILF